MEISVVMVVGNQRESSAGPLRGLMDEIPGPFPRHEAR